MNGFSERPSGAPPQLWCQALVLNLLQSLVNVGTLQGEMVQNKFGIPAVAGRQMEAYTTAVLEATVLPPAPARAQEWRAIMDSLSELSCTDYRSVSL